MTIIGSGLRQILWTSCRVTPFTGSTLSVRTYLLPINGCRWQHCRVTTAGVPMSLPAVPLQHGSLFRNRLFYQPRLPPMSPQSVSPRLLLSSSISSVSDTAVCVYEGQYSKFFKKLLQCSYYPLCIVISLRLLSLLDAETELLETATILTSLFSCYLPLMIYKYVQRFVLELYFNSETEQFTVVTLTRFCQRKYTTFTPADVQTTKQIMANFIISGKKYYVRNELIRNRAAVMALLGHEEGIQAWHDGTIERQSWQQQKDFNEQIDNFHKTS